MSPQSSGRAVDPGHLEESAATHGDTGSEDYALDPSARLLLIDIGLSVGNVLRRAGLPGDTLSEGQVNLAPDRYFALWEAIAAECGAPDLPIQIGQAISVEAFSPPIFAAICSPNLSVAAARIAKYKALIGPLRLIVTPTTDGLELEVRWPPDQHPPEVLTTTELIFWVALARLATREHINPVSVISAQPPAASADLADYFGVSVVHGHKYAVTFAHDDAARPFLTANGSMWNVFEPDLRNRLAQLQRNASTSDRVHAALLELLPAGRASVARVAAEMAVAIRTLQAQLKTEGTTYQAVLNRTREQLARHYLDQPSLSDTDIAFLLGYDEPNSFYRAFRTWTGQTPSTVRVSTAPIST